MHITTEIKTSLRREYALCSNAMAFYKKNVKDLEKKYHITTTAFLKRFEAGQMGDEADYFDWYAFAKLLAQCRKIQSVLRSAVR